MMQSQYVYHFLTPGFFFFFLLLAFHSLYASLILVMASFLRLSRSSQRSLRALSASMMAYSLFLSSQISEKCLLRLLSQSATLLSSFCAQFLVLLQVNISLSQLLMRSMSWAQLVDFQFLFLLSSLVFSSLSFWSFPFSVLIYALSFSSLVRWSLTSPSCSCLFSLLIFQISFSLQFLTSLIWLLSLSISSFFSSVWRARSWRRWSRSASQLPLVFSSDYILVQRSLIICACESSSSAAVASIFCIMILQLERDSQMELPSLLPVELVLEVAFSVLSISRSLGLFSRKRERERKLYSISFLTRIYSCVFSSSTFSLSRSCCSIPASPLNSSSILASRMIRSRRGGESQLTRFLLSLLVLLELLYSLNLMMKSESRLRKMAMRSMSRSSILRVRCASTMVGLPRVCLRLLMIQLLRFFAYCTFLAWPAGLFILKLLPFNYKPTAFS